MTKSMVSFFPLSADVEAERLVSLDAGLSCVAIDLLIWMGDATCFSGDFYLAWVFIDGFLGPLGFSFLSPSSFQAI